MTVYGDKIYEKQFSVREWGKYPSEEVIRFFMRAKEKLNPTEIQALDLGCGIGACVGAIFAQAEPTPLPEICVAIFKVV